jgi:chromosome partitioning protein
MMITVTSYKGDVGKTTTTVHLAAYLQRLSLTLLVDGDGTRSATKWSQRGTGQGLPFKVIPAAQMAKHLRDYEHVVIHTEVNPSDEDFRELAEGCDLMVIPAEPENVATDGLIHTPEKLQAFRVSRYKVPLTKVPPPPRTEEKQLREMLVAESFPVFAPEIPRLAAFEKTAAGVVPLYGVKDERAARAWDAYEAVGKEITKGKFGAIRTVRQEHLDQQLDSALGPQPTPIGIIGRPAGK